MHFCVKCDNMYYMKLESATGNELKYYCRNCGHEDELLHSESLCVSKIQFKKAIQKFNHIINPYTKLDPTLPRVTNIMCPNKECKSHNKLDNIDSMETIENVNIKKNNEVIYIRYDDDNMKFIYLCTSCEHVWKTEDR